MLCTECTPKWKRNVRTSVRCNIISSSTTFSLLFGQTGVKSANSEISQEFFKSVGTPCYMNWITKKYFLSYFVLPPCEPVDKTWDTNFKIVQCYTATPQSTASQVTKLLCQIVADTVSSPRNETSFCRAFLLASITFHRCSRCSGQLVHQYMTNYQLY